MVTRPDTKRVLDQLREAMPDAVEGIPLVDDEGNRVEGFRVINGRVDSLVVVCGDEIVFQFPTRGTGTGTGLPRTKVKTPYRVTDGGFSPEDIQRILKAFEQAFRDRP